MHRLVKCLAGIALYAAVASGQDPSSLGRQYEAMSKSTSLIEEGMTPFHVKIEAQLYDLKGKPSETGTIEEWWAAPGKSRIQVNSGSLHEVGGGEGHAPISPVHRSVILLEELLGQTVHPLSSVASYNDIVFETTKVKIASTTLNCFVLSHRDRQRTGVDPRTICSDPENKNFLAEFGSGAATIVRTKIGVFHQANVALGTQIAYLGMMAATGKVTVLQTWDAAQQAKSEAGSDAGFLSDSSAAAAATPVRGHNISHRPPTYPAMARSAHVSGSVVIAAIISTGGTIKSLDVIASPDVNLSNAAMDAMRTWTYEPSLLNGKPVEVSVLITVNFNLSSTMTLR